RRQPDGQRRGPRRRLAEGARVSRRDLTAACGRDADTQYGADECRVPDAVGEPRTRFLAEGHVDVAGTAEARRELVADRPARLAQPGAHRGVYPVTAFGVSTVDDRETGTGGKDPAVGGGRHPRAQHATRAVARSGVQPVPGVGRPVEVPAVV